MRILEKWEALYNNLKKNNIPVVEVEEDYFMIFNDKIRRCSDSVYDRYKFYYENDKSNITRESQKNKLNMSVELEYINSEISLWKDLKEFIKRLNEKDIDIANQSYEKFITEGYNLSRPHIGYIDNSMVNIDSITKLNCNSQYKIKICTNTSTFSKISKIPLNNTRRFTIENKIDWMINIIKHSSVGIIENVNHSKDELEYIFEILVEVVK